MGSTDKTYNETLKMTEYLDDTGYQYESFIFTVDFENADFGELTDFVVTEAQDFSLVLYGNKVDEEGNIVNAIIYCHRFNGNCLSIEDLNQILGPRSELSDFNFFYIYVI